MAAVTPVKAAFETVAGVKLETPEKISIPKKMALGSVQPPKMKVNLSKDKDLTKAMSNKKIKKPKKSLMQMIAEGQLKPINQSRLSRRQLVHGWFV